MRLAEVIGALALAVDLSSRMAPEKGLRTVLVATRLARHLGLDDAEIANVFWVGALRFVGCLGFAHEAAPFGAGDDNGVREAMSFVNPDRPLDALQRVVKGFGVGAPPLERAAGVARFFLDSSLAGRHAQADCECAVFFAQSLGMSEQVERAIDATFERFDGRGPRRFPSERLPIAARLVDVADVLELYGWVGGPELGRSELERRRGRALDPALVDAALRDLPDLLAGLAAGSVWEEYLAAEPDPLRVSGDEVEQGYVALGRFGDMKSVYTLAHSRRVSELAVRAGQVLGVSTAESKLLERAGHVHDIGRVAVANGTWDKRGALNAIEWQRVRAHSHHTETVLRGAGLDELATVAGATHERGRGAGYHKGLPADGIPFLAKVVAAADVMAALGEVRPHRPALDANAAVKELRALVADGALDARAAQAVLEASGAAPQRKGAWPGGLSDREVEVVRLVAVGRTNKEIGSLLGMSSRTAQKHVMNVYDKLGLESRAGVALYAVEHGLLDSARD